MPDDADLVHADRLRAIATALPEATEVDTFGNPTFRVATKPFAVYERVGGAPVVRVKLPAADQAALLDRPGFEPAPGTGHRGWTNIRLDLGVDWHEIDRLVVASYRQQAPGGLRRALDELLAAAGEEPPQEDEPVTVDLSPDPVPARVLRIVTVPGADVDAVAAAEAAWRVATEGRRARSRVLVAQRADPAAVVVLVEYGSAAEAAIDRDLPETGPHHERLAALARGPVSVDDLVLHHLEAR